jgi:hypothetical protein
MSPALPKLASRTLPAFLLAAFIAAQVGLAAHWHPDDDHLGDCLLCQLDHVEAAVVASTPRPLPLEAAAPIEHRPAAAPLTDRYRSNARGPPALS